MKGPSPAIPGGSMATRKLFLTFLKNAAVIKKQILLPFSGIIMTLRRLVPECLSLRFAEPAADFA